MIRFSLVTAVWMRHASHSWAIIVYLLRVKNESENSYQNKNEVCLFLTDIVLKIWYVIVIFYINFIFLGHIISPLLIGDISITYTHANVLSKYPTYRWWYKCKSEMRVNLTLLWSAVMIRENLMIFKSFHPNFLILHFHFENI